MSKHIFTGLLVTMVCSCLAWAEPAKVDPKDLESLFGDMQAVSSTDAPDVVSTANGFIRFLAAPPKGQFRVTLPSGKGANAETLAYTFMKDNMGAFSQESAALGLGVSRVTAGTSSRFVRLQQTYNGVPVFAAMATVQVSNDGVLSVISDVMRDATALDSGAVSLTPAIASSDAKVKAIAWLKDWAKKQTPAISLDDAVVWGTNPDLQVFDPQVVGSEGGSRVAWRLVVTAENASAPLLSEEILLDVANGSVLFHFSRLYEAKNREVYDADSTYAIPGTLARAEGDSPSDIEDVNLAYDAMGALYDFYWQRHSRDSIDNEGMTLVSTVRACHYYYGCPMENAYYSSYTQSMAFGTGFVSDEIVGHEMTHGVTDFSSNLIYYGQSGAINECFSDLWGESVDLTNPMGLDTTEMRWALGEDIPVGESFPEGGPMRDMKNPPKFQNPDKMSSPYYYMGAGDNGGVHTNSGVGNKMYYLLVDGDSFNDFKTYGMGIDRTIRLYYMAQTSILTPASDYNDLAFALVQAARDMEYTTAEIANVITAGLAVEILNPQIQAVRHFRALTSPGYPGTLLTWKPPYMFAGLPFVHPDFKGVTIVKRGDKFPENVDDGEFVYSGRDSYCIDVDSPGSDAYYAMFVDYSGLDDVPRNAVTEFYAHANVGSQMADFLVESFDRVASQPFDLAFNQITFAPVGNPFTAQGSGRPQDLADYSNYTVSREKNVPKLPVDRFDADGSAFQMPMVDFGISEFALPGGLQIPFFGQFYDTLYVGANGFVAFDQISSDAAENFPSLESHYESRKISFLFADLSPKSGGEIWGRQMKDRIVITFSHVPEYVKGGNISQKTNTAQLELFYSGHIRITYQEVNADLLVVGLSDGRGVPIDPSTVSAELPEILPTVNLSDLSPRPSQVTLDPIPVQIGAAGSVIEFTVKANCPSATDIPVMAALWNESGPVPFADRQDGTGLFRWQTTMDDIGVYQVTVGALLGADIAYQIVPIIIELVDMPPSANRLLLRSTNILEDPSVDRAVSTDSWLEAKYNYVNLGMVREPDLFGEGATQLSWYRNFALVPGMTNLMTVPPEATQIGDTWFFTVLPRTKSSLNGEPLEGAIVRSPIVTVVNSPTISSVSPVSGPTTGGITVKITGTRLSVPSKVTFGNIDVQEIRSLGDDALEVVLPTHGAGVVDVYVVAASGTVLSSRAFTYIGGDQNGDTKVDAIDVQLVTNGVLSAGKKALKIGSVLDANGDGAVNAADIQAVVGLALRR